MGRRVRDFRLETRESRKKLKQQQNPYWRLINSNVHLGYRKGARCGQWYFRIYHEEKYIKRVMAEADDFADANGVTVLSFDQAQDLARRKAIEITTNEKWDDKPYTIKDAVADYLEDYKANGKKSFYSTEKQINAHILSEFENTPICKLTFEMLNNWKNKLATSPKRKRTGLGKEQQFETNQEDDPEYNRKRRATANRIINMLKAILNHAFNNDKVKNNEVWSKLKPFKNVSEPKIRFLTPNECERLLNSCDPDFKLLVRAALLLGARYGELTNLKVADYHHNNNSIYIHESKSGKPRHIPLSDKGVDFFDQITTGKLANENIFTRSDGTLWKRSYQIRPLKAACDRAKIHPVINFHILRHTYASSLAMRGVPLQVIASVLGHSDTRVTHKHYAHLMPSYIADVIKGNLPNFGNNENTNVISINSNQHTKDSNDKLQKTP